MARFGRPLLRVAGAVVLSAATLPLFAGPGVAVVPMPTAGTASDVAYPPTLPPTVPPTLPPGTPASVVPEVTPAGLADTGGSNTEAVIGTAAVLVLGGAALVVATRRRGNHTAP